MMTLSGARVNPQPARHFLDPPSRRGRTWTIGAWCERREDFRNFRVDRIAGLETLERHAAANDFETDFRRVLSRRSTVAAI